MKSIQSSGAIYFAIMLVSSSTLAHQGHVEDKAVQACKQKVVSSSCGYESETHKYSGSCQMIIDHMICVRNQPLEKKLDEMSVEDLDRKAGRSS